MKKFIHISIVLLVSTSMSFAQKVVEGFVNDSTGAPVAGATVIIKNSKYGDVTDQNGKYSISTKLNPPFTLEVKFLGFKTQVVEVSSLDNPILISLQEESEQLSEVTVTSRRREEKAQDIPIPISVVGGPQIENSGSFNVNRVKELIPTVTLYSSNPRNTTLNIRGLGSTFGLTNDGLDPGVGLYIDGVYIARPAATALDFIDVDKIEVLRGPQGTLFGKNTTAGAFNITTRAPQFKPGGTFELSYGNFGYIQAKTSITGPILNNRLAARVSFSGTQRDGTIYNVRSDKYLNDINNLGIKGQLLYTPNDKIRITLSGDATRQRPQEGYSQVIAGVVTTKRSEYRQFRNIIADLGWQLASENPFDRKVDQNSTWRAGNDLGGVSLNADFKIGKGTLTSTSAWRYWNWDPLNDRDFTGLNSTSKSQAPSKHNNWSQEIRYAGDFTKHLSGVIGVYAIGQDLVTDPVHTEEAGSDFWRFQQNTTNTALWQTPGLFDGHGSAITSRLRSNGAAVFANLDWAITKKLHVLPGIRFNYDQKIVNYKREAYGLYETTDPDLRAIRTIYTNQQFDFKTDERNWTGQLTLAYKPIDQINAFATYSTSYKPIGVNLGGLPNVDGKPDLSLAQVKPEFVSHVEIGIKTTPTKNTILNVIVHNTDIKDYQTIVQDPNPSLLRGYLANADRVNVKGLEIDGSVQIAKSFVLNGAVAYTDARYVRFTNAPLPLEETGARDPDGKEVPFVDASGGRLPGVSKWAGSLGAEVSTKGNFLGSSGRYFLGVDGYYRSEFSSSPTPSQFLNIDGYTIFNARLGFRVNKGTSLFFWGRNIFDKNYFEQLLPGAGNAGHYAAVLGDPRTYGVTLRHTF